MMSEPRVVSPAPQPVQSNTHDTLNLYLSRGQAGVMAFFGVGIAFGAVLLTFVQFEPGVPLGWRVAVGLLSLYLLWVGVAYVQGALKHLRQPVFTLDGEALTGHEAMQECRVPLGEITGLKRREVRGIVYTVVQFPGGTVEIPHTLMGAVEADRRLCSVLQARQATDAASGTRG